MAEKRRKIDIITHSSRATPTEIDWEKCFICQKTISKESLQSPFNSPVRGSDPKQTYETLAENIKKFQSTGQLPVANIQIEKLENGSQLGDELHKNKAKYHKSCKLKFAGSKLPKSPQNQSIVLPDSPEFPLHQSRNSKRLSCTPTQEL